MKRFAFLLATALLLASGGSARAQGVEDAGGGAPQFQAGDIISIDEVDKLKPFLPEDLVDQIRKTLAEPTLE